MVFLLILVLLILTILLNKRQLGNAMIFLIAASNLANLVAANLASFIVNLGIKTNHKWLTSLITIIMIIIPMLVVIYRSHKRNRTTLKITIEALILTLAMIILVGPSLTNLIKIDQLSINILKIITNQSKIILILTGCYGFWQLIIKDEE